MIHRTDRDSHLQRGSPSGEPEWIGRLTGEEQTQEREHRRLLLEDSFVRLGSDGEKIAALRDDSSHRRRIEWGIGGAYWGISGTMKTLLRVIAIQMSCDGDPASRKLSWYAHDAGLHMSRLYGLLKEASRKGLLIKRTPSDQERKDSEKRTARDDFGGPWIIVTTYPSLVARRALQAMWSLPRPEEPPVGVGVRLERWRWEKEIRRSDLSTASKGVAMASGLLSRDSGFPMRSTTRSEICSLSGFSGTTVRRSIADLEAGSWMEVTRQSGRGGGLGLRLRYPPTIERMVEAEDRAEREKYGVELDSDWEDRGYPESPETGDGA